MQIVKVFCYTHSKLNFRKFYKLNLHRKEHIDITEKMDQKWSTITHGVAFVFFFLISFPYLYYIFSVHETSGLKIGALIFCLATLAVYGSSTLYHAFYFTENVSFFRRLDHICIYLLIAGTNTPFVLTYLDFWLSTTIMVGLWAMVAVGVYLKAYHFERVAWFSLPMYLVMGWLGLLTVFFAYPSLSFECLAFLLAGGSIYTLGTIFYNSEHIPYNHTIWHFFVIAGTCCHFIAIYLLA